jgi:hypothetical protein
VPDRGESWVANRLFQPKAPFSDARYQPRVRAEVQAPFESVQLTGLTAP